MRSILLHPSSLFSKREGLQEPHPKSAGWWRQLSLVSVSLDVNFNAGNVESLAGGVNVSVSSCMLFSFQVLQVAAKPRRHKPVSLCLSIRQAAEAGKLLFVCLINFMHQLIIYSEKSLKQKYSSGISYLKTKSMSSCTFVTKDPFKPFVRFCLCVYLYDPEGH